MKFFILEDSDARIELFSDALYGHELTIAKSKDEGLKWWNRDQGKYDVVLLDHDLGGKQYLDPRGSEPNTGMKFVEAVADKPMPNRIIIHSYNLAGAVAMEAHLRDCGHACVRIPFGEKLLEMLSDPLFK